MIGMPIIGKFTAYKSGHELNNKLLRLMLKEKTKWAIEYLDLGSEKTASLASNYLRDKGNFKNKNLEVAQ